MRTEFQKVVESFQADGMALQVHADREIATAGFQRRHGVVRVHFLVDEQQEVFQIYAMVPLTVPEASRPAIAEATTRANYGMRIGKFEMDYSDGDLRFHVANAYVGSQDPAMVRRLLFTAVHFADAYFPAFAAIVYAKAEAKAEIDRVEEGFRTPAPSAA